MPATKTLRSKWASAPQTLSSAICALIILAAAANALSQVPSTPEVPQSSYQALRWRCIGPHRGGRALAVSGVRGQPETYYFGAVGGGVWKTTNGGEVWQPIFDAQPISSIGALAVAPSDPNVIYVGSGEADMRSDISFGDGMYKSTDAGKTWTQLGLRDTRQIGRILVDPKDANIVLVAALGHGFGANDERGVFRSIDGGKSWKRVLYKNEDVGAIELAFDPDDSRTVYAALWNTRRPAWSVYAPITGPGGGLFKSIDGGVTWSELTGHGLPAGRLGRIGIDVAAGQKGQRVYVLIDAEKGAGLYRSDDGGRNWQLVCTDSRLTSRAWYFSEVRIDPRNPDLVYVSNVSLYRSIDGGKNFIAIKGAPGGDDYHSLWIDPENPRRMISGVDQGVIISVDAGESWTSWYNQPTAQFYHVAVDNQFPYWVYGAQQDSGTAAVVSRSDYGQITFRDWHPIGAGESGNILPDPADPNIVFGGSTGGELFRFNNKTGQVQDITPTVAAVGGKIAHRYPWTTPIAFVPQTHALLQASQFLFRSTDAGNSWTIISPDLTLRPGDQEAEAKGVVNTIAPSPIKAGQIWIGTDNGLIQLTEDEGGNWRDVSPKALPPWSMISVIDASPFDAGTAYAAIDRHQMDDLQPYIYRTRDAGKTWTKISSGINANAYVHAVREDPKRKGLLYAGTETGVYVSFNDGDHWQPLQLNLPVTPIRDLVIKDNDLVVATHGRSFWILDDLSPLRELTQSNAAAVHLFKPAPAIRLRKNENRDTPLPRETPAGQNPPTGALIYYNLNSVPAGIVTLEIFDASGQLIRKYSSDEKALPVDDQQAFPTYWLPAQTALPKQRGLNLFVWDLRYDRPQALRYGYSIAAVPGDAILQPEGPMALPGRYQVRLTVNGHSYTTPLEIKQDPRVRVPTEVLTQQRDLEIKIAVSMAGSAQAYRDIRDLRRQLDALQTGLKNDQRNQEVIGATTALNSVLLRIGGSGQPQFPPPTEPTLSSLNGALTSLSVNVDSADAAPTEQAIQAFQIYQELIRRQLERWALVKSKDLPALNTLLRQQGLPAISLTK